MKLISSKIVIGTAQFGFDYGISNTTGKVSEDEAFKILDLAEKLGINFIDTAYAYGDSHKIIGKYLKSNVKNGIEVITKISNNHGDYKAQWKKTLIDLSVPPFTLLMHDPKDLDDKKFVKFLLEKKSNKEVKRIGVSVYDSNDLDNILSLFTPDIIQLPINIFNREFFENGILEELKKRNIEIHARSVFLQGLCFLENYDIKEKFSFFSEKIIKFKSIIEEKGLSLPEVSINWVNSISQIDKIIIGVTNSTELLLNFEYLRKKINIKDFEDILKFEFNDKNLINPYLWKN